MALEDRYNPQLAEKKWQEFWEKEGIYKFNPNDKRPIFSVDTPPPTISGDMHLGHSFSYSQQDFLIRYKRMAGFNVFYPFGTDDNGLATERLVEKINKVKSRSMSRKEFVRLCLKTLDQIRPNYISDWKKLGMSCDFSIYYTTINDHCQRISQKSFIDLYKMGREYRKEAPTIWCPECQTAIAQVELEDRELKSYFNDIIFKIDREEVIIATTRPELLPACVAVFFHPEDKRYQKHAGKKAFVPLFNYEVPVLQDPRVSMEKGTGIVMCCTFGDQTDAEWYKQYKLPLRVALSRDGKMTALAKGYEGQKIAEARKNIIQDLTHAGLLTSQKEIIHVVNVHERCGTEIEILETKQWFIKYLDLKEKFLEHGRKLHWYPPYMYVRLENWIKGLQWDWCISRQRYYGVPFPVWYCRKCGETILAEEKQLPVDPLEDHPSKPCRCGSTDFEPEQDVLDTWATSSLTPKLAVALFRDKKVFKKLYPMTLRPQAHDIITFWLFNTMVKSILHENKNPWRDVVISGFALDPHGKKMSKSKGNAIAPQEMMKKYCADSLRFWAAGSKLGEDLPFQEKDLVTGQKMVTKLWNASRFVTMNLQDFDIKKIQPEKLALRAVDEWILSKMQAIIKEATETFGHYEYSKTKADVELFFWKSFCDNYLEIVKERLYTEERFGKAGKEAAQFTLYTILLDILKLIAPIMPHITEEVYQSYFALHEKPKSIHLFDWPKPEKRFIKETHERGGDLAVLIIAECRKQKSLKSLSLKAEIKKIVISTGKEEQQLLKDFLDDIKSTVKAVEIEFGEAGEIAVSETLKLKIVF
ncbi:MAG: valine--tRNA ligase [Nanoarchaeota archaeon]